MSAVVQLTDVEQSFAGGFRLAVERFELAPGERVACIGPSGSGKTTLVNLTAGILTPARGRIVALGQELTRLDDRARRRFRRSSIGLVFQELELVEYLSARDNVLLPCWIDGSPKRADREHAEELAAALGLTDLLDRKPARLSQGERQRVAIARALVTEPPLVLCDEPTGNLDPDTGRRTLDLLFDEAERRGTTVLFVTHDHSLLERFDRTIDIRELARPTVAEEASP